MEKKELKADRLIIEQKTPLTMKMDKEFRRNEVLRKQLRKMEQAAMGIPLQISSVCMVL